MPESTDNKTEYGYRMATSRFAINEGYDSLWMRPWEFVDWMVSLKDGEKNAEIARFESNDEKISDLETENSALKAEIQRLSSGEANPELYDENKQLRADRDALKTRLDRITGICCSYGLNGIIRSICGDPVKLANAIISRILEVSKREEEGQPALENTVVVGDAPDDLICPNCKKVTETTVIIVAGGGRPRPVIIPQCLECGHAYWIESKKWRSKPQRNAEP